MSQMNYRTYSVLWISSVDQGQQIGRQIVSPLIRHEKYPLFEYINFQNSRYSEFSTLHYRANSLVQVGLVVDGVR